MSFTIATDFDGLKRMARELLDALPALDHDGVENGLKAFGLAYLGCEFPDDLRGRANRDAAAPALFRIVQREVLQRQIELDAALLHSAN